MKAIRTARVAKRVKRTIRALPHSILIASLLTFVMLFQAVVVPVALAHGYGATAKSRGLRGETTPPSATAEPAQDFAQQAVTVEAAIVKHAPLVNNARVEGSLRQLTGESVTLNSGAVVTSNLLVPGTPQVVVNGNVSFGGTIQGTGSAQPSGYSVILNGAVTLGHLVTRTDAIAMPSVAAPSTPTGTRNVTINTPGQSIGDPATLRNLTLNSNVGTIAVPPGTYGSFIANSGGTLAIGVANSTQPAAYNLQSLTLNGGSQLQVVGPVVLTVNSSVTINAAAGAPTNPLWLKLDVAAGGVTLNSSSSLYAIVRAPSGTISLNGNTLLQGSVTCDRLTLNGGILRGAGGVIDSLSPTRATQGQSLNVTLKGANTHWVAGKTNASFGGEVSVGGAAAGAFGPLQVIDATTATAQLVVSPTAALAPRTVQVSTTIFLPDEVETETLIDGFTVVSATPPGSSQSTVTTVAGLAGAPGFADGASATARFRDLAGIAVAADDTIYVADAGNHRIRRIAPNGTVSTLAGNGTAGFADGAGNTAKFNSPQGVAVDTNGIVYVADTANHRIRRIAADGTVSTLAGDGTPGLVNGTGAQARFSAPRGLAIDPTGNLYVADSGNSAVRVITGGNVNTLAGDGTIGANDSPAARFNGLAGVGVDGATLYIYAADTGNHRIRRLTPGGAVITIAGADRGFADGSATSARFADPSGIALDGAGKIIVADATNSLVRLVDAELALGGSPVAVATIAGAGERGATDGAGNVARFLTPQGVAVSLSSAILVADTGNQVVRRILLPPIITAISPSQAHPADTITITGERFDGRAPSGNVVSFTKTGGGQTVAQVIAASRTQLTVIVPANATTGPVTVQTQGGTATSSANFVVLPPTPVINDFNPKHGAIGTTVTLTGTNLKTDSGATSVTFAGSSGNRLPALISSLTPTQAEVIVPNAAVTGVIRLTTPGGQAETNQSFTVDFEGYQLTLSPSSASAVQRTSAIYVASITSSTTFSQLASLTINGLPAGVSASFNPNQITAGASSTLSLNLANADLSPGSYPFTIQATALVDGSPLVRTASATLTVIAAGRTTLSGRVLSTEREPIIGATVSLDGKTATTDVAGGFLLFDVTAGESRPLMVDGRTASAPNRTYPVIVEPATVVAGQANIIPYIFYLPAIDTQFEVDVVPGRDTVVSTPKVPGLQVTIPAGANLRNRDGSPVPRVSITPVAVDRTPTPIPDNVAPGVVLTLQPGGAISDVPMPVSFPNLMGADPGTRATLYAFDHDTVQWYVYGYGRVSADGRTIDPEIDPQTGKPYGLRNFSWYFPDTGPSGNTGDPGDCPSNRTGHPVDLSTGVKIESRADILFSSARGGLTLARTYTSELAQSCDSCTFGRGWTSNYAIRLTGTFESGGAGRVAFPEQVRGRLFSYARTDSDGTLVFTSTATTGQLKDVVRKLTNGTYEYRYKEGGLMRFAATGRLTAIVDPNGNTTSLTYTSENLTQITDAVGRSITLDYDSQNRVSRATDPLGRTWVYQYNDTPGGAQGLTSVTDPLNGVTRYEYAAGNRLAKVIDKRGTTVKEITYNGAGRVVQQKFADGGIQQFSYGLSGSLVTSVTATDPLGRTATKRFNTSGYVIEQTDGLGQTAVISRDLSTNLPLSTTGPCGCAEVTREFNATGNLISMTDRLGHKTRYEYEPVYNKVSKITDPLGHAATFGYDSRGNLTTITDTLNRTLIMTYDAFGELLSVAGPSGHTSHFEYDGSGNVVASRDALDHRSTMEYDAIGRRTASNDPLGRRATMQYDLLDRVISFTGPAGATTHVIYDANGNATSLTNALGKVWASAYDTKNRVTSTTDPLGRTTQYVYNQGNQLLRVISPLGRTMQYGYDGRGQLKQITDPLGSQSQFTHDHHGKLTSVVDQRGYATTFTYDELYRRTGTRNPLGQTSGVTYDAVGNVTEAVDRLGRRTLLSYDDLYRITRAVYADATVTYSYDNASRLTHIDDTQSGSIDWTYDDANRLLNETTAAGTVSYAYNAASDLVSMTAADRPAVLYGYDAAGRVNSISQGAETFTYTYDTLSRRASLQRPNGITTTYSYDEVSRLTRMLHAGAQGQPVEDYRYRYSLDNQIIAISSLASASQPPAAVSVGAADAANRITQFGAANLTFDAEGQTTAKSNGQGTTNYQWDVRGRLTQVGLANGQSVSYGYDAAGRLARRTAGGQTTSFLYDGAEVVLDRTDNSSGIDYINGLGIDDKLRQTSAAGRHYFLQDHLGSTIALVDSSGAVVERQQYEPFGATSGSALTRYGYTGRELDSATGLMYYRARWYDPQQGRFITQDPLGLAGGSNLYTYAANDPINRSDPSGLKPCSGSDPLLNFFAGLGDFLTGIGPGGSRDLVDPMHPGGIIFGEPPHTFSNILSKVTDRPIEYQSGAYRNGVATGEFILIDAVAGPAGEAIAESVAELPSVIRGLAEAEEAAGEGAALEFESIGVEAKAATELEGIQITEEGLARVESHLTETPGLTAEAPEMKMLERLKAGERTAQDLRFYEHEMIESQELKETQKLYSDPVDAVREAHFRTLKRQGLYYRGYEKELYHPDALRLIER